MSASTSKPMQAASQDTDDIDQEQAAGLKEAFERGGMSELKAKVEEDKDKWRNVPVNIAVTGNSGAGKSSFINSFRGLKAKDEGAAAVGVNETTMEPTKYMHPNNNSIALWDLPGIGTQKFPKETYLKKVDFEKYDFFLIITSKRFTENDIWLAKEVNQLKKKFFFIRTKMNEDVVNEEEDNGTSKSVTVNKVQEEMTQQVAKENFENVKVYLIDNRSAQDYDFAILTETMIKEAPAWKQDAMILTLTTITEDLINRKRKTLRKRILLVAVVPGLCAAVPIPGTGIASDLALLIEELYFYKEQFGLNEESLKKTSNLIGKGFEAIRCGLQTSVPAVEFVKSNVKKTMTKEVADKVASIVFPILGSIIVAGLSYGNTVYILRSMLDKCVSDARKLNEQLKQTITNK